MQKEIIGKATLYLGDCRDGMAERADKAFSLAIVDPPYGIDAGNMVMGKGQNKQWGGKKNWDSEIPDSRYFAELFRTSERQIIWGGNYFPLPLTGGWLFWNKDRDKDVSFADGELAWTNFLNTLKEAKIKYDGFLGADKDGRIHPTQKPVRLYSWLLNKYAKLGDEILDTHLGSGSSVIACLERGYNVTAYEIDPEYFEAACLRIERSQQQQLLAF
ncbi:MAG TPA: hypothetical protein DCS42_02410 [Nitrospiraceae bacterium]|nr:hypothetical protein [Nitrospiraceae bacterium]